MKQKISILFSALIITASFTACSSSNNESSLSSSTESSETESSKDESSDILEESSTMNDYSLEDYAKSVKETYDTDYIPDMEISEEDFSEKFGLSTDMYDEIWGEGSTLPENPDVFIAVKAKSESVEEVETALENYRQELLTSTEFESHVDKISASQVYTNGDYVFLMILGANEFVDTGEDIAQGFEDEFQKGIDALEEMFK